MADEPTPDPVPQAPVAPATPPPMPSRSGALTHESDRAIRPGFRNPDTPRSLSQKKARKKK